MPNVIVGRKPVIEALKAGRAVEKIMLLSGVRGTVIAEIRELAERKGVRCEEATRQDFRGLATDAVTQGVLALVKAKDFVNLEDLLREARERGEKGFLLVLDEIVDPHNLGALIRTAECAGVHGVVIPKHHAAPVTSTVIKASAGATEHIPMAEVTNLVQAINRLKEDDYWVAGLDAAGEKPYTDVDYTSSVAIVVGNEGKGMRRLVKECCDFLVKIPLRGNVASLNASVAGGLVMFEVARQRGSPQSP